jgi:hypothetical protein
VPLCNRGHRLSGGASGFACGEVDTHGAWVTQQARNLSFTGLHERMRFLIHDRDGKFTAAFDDVFRSDGLNVIHTPIRAPQANAYAERFVRTIRAECLDWLLILGRRHLEQVLRTSSTTTASDRTADSHSGRLNRQVSSDHPAAMSSAAIALAVSPTSTTEPQSE